MEMSEKYINGEKQKKEADRRIFLNATTHEASASIRHPGNHLAKVYFGTGISLSGARDSFAYLKGVLVLRTYTYSSSWV